MKLKDNNKKRRVYLEAIYRICLVKGFKDLKIDDIAEEIGITKMTLYNNFDNKDEIIKSVLSYRSNKYIEFIGSMDQSKNNAIDDLMAVLAFQDEFPLPEIPTFYLSFLKAYPRVYRLYKAKLRRILKLFIINNIKKGVEEGIYLSDINSDNIANFAINTMDNMIDKWLNKEVHLDLKTTHEHIITYHIRGIANQRGLKILETYKKEGFKK